MTARFAVINGSLNDSVVNLNDTLIIIKENLSSLRDHIRTKSFLSDQDEIDFFKYTKPAFQAWQHYYIELYNIISSTPVGTEDMIRNYYVNEINVIDRFFKIHAFFYQYYLKDENSKDNIYFLRRYRSLFPPSAENSSLETEFSTELDHLFSMFRAYEMLKDFIIRRIKLLIKETSDIFINTLLKKRQRSWSGDKVDLVEIAYGIYYTARVNNGKAEISDIIHWLEDSFNVDLSQAYRMFVDIRRRKTVSYTKYLDEMRNNINAQIENSFKFRSK
ncbi:RteC domain-containing protein [Sphingobacterium sp. HMA12]|uniref:RteC domain-containing protein n=1 Tax=Sphingobacterium sp. HMA12 TaxID=2050894 RepID=UPI001F19C695|nr:RteC domain-containing protein [Sphingobacterium sp. HMA12]